MCIIWLEHNTSNFTKFEDHWKIKGRKKGGHMNVKDTIMWKIITGLCPTFSNYVGIVWNDGMRQESGIPAHHLGRKSKLLRKMGGKNCKILVRMELTNAHTIDITIAWKGAKQYSYVFMSSSMNPTLRSSHKYATVASPIWNAFIFQQEKNGSFPDITILLKWNYSKY